MFLRQERGGVVYTAAAQLNGEGAVHGFSTRLGGVSEGPYASLNLGPATGDDRERVEENFRRFCAAVGADVERVVCTRQVHRDEVRVVTADDAGKGLWRERDYEADGLVTNETGLPLVIFTADCTPILFHDPVKGVIGACHAGWRGTALGIAGKTVDTMAAVYGCAPEHIRCAIGPCISRCCFETRGDVKEAMLTSVGPETLPFIDDHGNGFYHVDLKGINRLWLERRGVAAERIEVSDDCTACDLHTYYSHRRTGLPRGSLAHIIQLV